LWELPLGLVEISIVISHFNLLWKIKEGEEEGDNIAMFDFCLAAAIW
jgi:hypothetical protein